MSFIASVTFEIYFDEDTTQIIILGQFSEFFIKYHRKFLSAKYMKMGRTKKSTVGEPAAKGKPKKIERSGPEKSSVGRAVELSNQDGRKVNKGMETVGEMCKSTRTVKKTAKALGSPPQAKKRREEVAVSQASAGKGNKLSKP